MNWLKKISKNVWLNHRNLYGRQSPTSKFYQSLVARRLQNFTAKIETAVDFNPEDFRQMAGLICYYDESNFRYIRISYNDSIGRNVAVISMDRGKPDISDPEDIPDEGTVYLKADFRNSLLRLYWSNDGVMWRQVGEDYDAGKLSDEYCHGFTGTFVGMCANDMTGRRLHADFDYFKYKGR